MKGNDAKTFKDHHLGSDFFLQDDCW